MEPQRRQWWRRRKRVKDLVHVGESQVREEGSGYNSFVSKLLDGIHNIK